MPNMRHGIITPVSRGNGVPGRVVNARSRQREQQNNRIRLDRLLRSPNPKILVKRRLGGIGDVIMTTPLLKAIKELIPHCELTYATDTEYANGALKDIIDHVPEVDIVVHNGTVQDNRFDYSVDVTTTGLKRERSGTIPPNRIDMFADEAGVDVSADPTPIYVMSKEELEDAKKILDSIIPEGKHNVIAIQVRSNDARRCWPEEHVKELVKLLAAKEKNQLLVFDWGNKVSRWKFEEKNVHLILDKTFNETAKLIHMSDIVVCPDSAILHLAGALNKRTVAIFGPIPAESRINHYPNAISVTKKVNCHPCWYTPTCRKNAGMTLECLSGLKPKTVEDAVYKKLAEDIMSPKNIVFGKDLTDKNQDPIILVRRTSPGMGDIIMTTPALAALKKKYPDKKIELACQKKLWPIMQNNPNVDILSDCNSGFNYRRYFMVIDISFPCARYESTRTQSNKPVQKSRVEIFAEAMNVRDMIRSIVPEYYPEEENTKWAKEFFVKHIKSKKPTVALALRSAEEYRDWPEEYYQKLIDKLKDNFEIIILDHSRVHKYKNVIDACGFDIRKAAAILQECDGLITVDTGLLHLAAAMDIKTIALFGPIDYKARCKGYKKVTVITADLNCSPCWRNSRIACKQTRMIQGNSECMRRLKPEQVAKITKEKINEHIPKSN